MRQTREISAQDAILIRRFQEGDAEAFDRPMSLHIDKVYNHSRGVLQNGEDATDCPPGAVKAYLSLAAAHFIGHLKKLNA